MQRKFRLTSATDFKRVRRFGSSHAHPLVMLISHPNDISRIRIGISASRKVGNAVARNRVKRQLRESLRPLIPSIQKGWDVLFIARESIAGATFSEIDAAVQKLLHQANLFAEEAPSTNKPDRES